MANKKNIVTVILLLSFLGLYAQEPSDAQRVNVHFSKTPLGEVLEQISSKYNVQFSYGNDHLKLNKQISFYSEGKTLEATLSLLFDENDIVYATIGDQLVLKPAKRSQKIRKKRQQRKKKREEEREERDKQTLERGTLFDFDIHSEIVGKTEALEKEEPQERILISTNPIEPLVAKSIGGEVRYQDQLNLDGPTETAQPIYRNMGAKWGQLSVLPFLGTAKGNFSTVNNVSFNLFWGINGGVNGVEIGGIGNSIKHNVHGFQFGGLFNSTKGHLYGGQIASIVNITKGEVGGFQLAGLANLGGNVYGAQLSILANVARDLYGTQFSGLSNIATDVYGFQVSGLFNFANGKLFGSQIAGIGNIAWGGKSAVQFAGLFNKSAKAQFQIAFGHNHAQEVEGAQISLVNVAKKVRGIQMGGINYTKELEGVQIGIINSAHTAKGLMIGFINIVDSVNTIPLGLINIIKKNGYNRWELSGGDAMYLNFGAKFGAKRLYHIVQGGWRIGSDNVYSWSAGVGIGTLFPVSKRCQLNLELLTSHVNEGAFITTDLNLLNQFKITFDIRLGKSNTSVFFGPAFNAMLSNRYNETTKSYGSNIMPYSLYHKNIFDHVQLNLWIGATAGIRF